MTIESNNLLLAKKNKKTKNQHQKIFQFKSNQAETPQPK